MTFYRDVLGLRLKFESPGWSEFVTGETILALHPASEKDPPGRVELGFTVGDVEVFYRDMSARGVIFSMPPTGFSGLSSNSSEQMLHTFIGNAIRPPNSQTTNDNCRNQILLIVEVA